MKHTLAILAGICLSSFVSLAQDATVHIHDGGNGETIPAEIYGQFSEHLGRCIYGGLWVGKDSQVPNIDGYRKDVFEALKVLKIPVLRWPGGCFGDVYHWMDGIGPQDQRPGGTNYQLRPEDNSFGTHEFLNLCEMLGIEPYISGNLGTGSPEEMVNWVNYMTAPAGTKMADLRAANGRKEPWKVKYFGIGNESWGCGGFMSPEYYSDVFRRYAGFIFDQPGNHILKISSGSLNDDYHRTDVLMERIGTMMQGLAVHFYSGFGKPNNATKFNDHSYYGLLSKTLDVENILKNHIAVMDKHDPQCRVGLYLDEWGTWYDAEPGTSDLYQQNTMRDAIVAALNFDIFHKYTRRLKMANIAQVVNVLQAMILTNENDMVITPTYHVFEMYNVHQGAQYLPSDIITPTMKGPYKDIPIPEVDATASKLDGRIHFDLVNTHLKETKTVLVEFDDPKAAGKVTSARILTSKKAQDYNDFDHKDTVIPKVFKDYKVTKAGIEVVLPPCCIVAFEVE